MGAGQRILFVSDDGTNDVDMFDLPAMTLVGTLTGFSEPQGMCTDKSHNVWITNTGTEQILSVLGYWYAAQDAERSQR